MTDNNWITPEWIEKLQGVYMVLFEEGKIKTGFYPFLSAEINKEIQNILDSAEKRDCKTCKRAQYTVYCQECFACYFETKKTYPNWTPKEGK